ncbi:phage tail tape measure protein [uncultured Alistipes sp.]|uniref:phage tail tape measure protein n=1 Tax=uncultured Alistipes sp. TaxID=538949 RepID=UPI0028055521|nr:phage tail tape measure protein [uncultured Alistipes sp.]
MAQDTIHKIIEITIKNSDLIEKMRESQNAIGALSNETKQLKQDIEEYRKSLKEGKITQEQFDRMMIQTKNEIIKNDQAVVKFKSDLRQYTREMQSNIRQDTAKTGSLNQMRASVRLLTSEFEALSAAERSGSRGQELVRQIRATTEEINRQEESIRNYHSSVGNYAGGIQKAFLKITAAWMAIRGLFSSLNNSIQKVRDFEQANADLGTIVGANADELKRLTDSALELGRTTEYTASQVTQLQTELAKLGFGTQSIETMQKPVLQFATAVGASLPEAAALAGATLRSFGLNVSDTEDVLATLAVATNRSALSFSYLKTAMSIVSPVANTFGFSVRDTAALLGTLADAGFDASSAATATRNILLNLADANGKLAQSLGAPVRTLPDLVSGLQRLRDRGIDLAETLELTDKRSVAAFNTFLNGSDNLRRLRENLEDVNGELGRIAEDRLNTVEGSIKLLQSAWEGFVLSFYNSRGTIKSVIDFITSGIEGINNLLDPDAQKNKQKDFFVEDLMSRYASGGDNALNTSIKAGLKFWGDRYETTRQRYSGSGGLFGKQDFKIAETMYKAFIEAGNEAIERVKQLKQEQADAAKQAEADAKASAAAAAKARSEAAAKAQQADEKAAAAQIKNAQQVAGEVLRMTQQMRDKTRENELQTLRENYDKDISDTRNRLAEISELEKTAGVQQGQALVMEREALNKKLLLLDEKYQKDRQDIDQKYSRKELENAVKSKSDEYRTRILQAQIDAGAGQEGEIAAAKEVLSILKEQLEYIELNADAFRDSGKSEADILAMRLDLLKQIEKANDNINSKTQKAISDETALAYKTASTAARAAGSLSAMFDALGGEGERYAEFAKALGVMQVVITEGIAIAKAVQGGAEYPFPINVLTVAASVAAITAAIASAVNSVKSTEVPKYASGGLISGPGTGTSDSIPAMLSNGEAVMTAAAVNEWGAMLSAMNVSSGGNAINVSNLPQRGDGMRGMRAMLKEALLDMPAPVVSVVDINKGQRKVQVQDNISKLGRKKYK